MSTTLTNLRKGLCERVGGYWTGTADSGDKNFLVDAALEDKVVQPSGYQYVYFPSGDNAGEKRLISEYTAEQQRVIWNRALSTAVSTDTYEILPFDPDDIVLALNHARTIEYPALCQLLDDETVVTRKLQNRYDLPSSFQDVRQVWLGNWIKPDENESLIDNGTFDDWDSSSDPADWSDPTNLTLAQEDDWVLAGSYSCKCTSTSSASSLYQDVSSPTDYLGQTLSFSIWVYCLTGSRVKASIHDGSDNQSSYHGGNGWEKLTVSLNIAASVSAIKVGVTVAAGTAIVFYLDDAFLYSTARYASSAYDILYNWRVINSVLNLRYQPTRNRPLRLIGMGYLSSVSAESDTMEIDHPQTELLYASAIHYLYRQMMSRSPSQSQPAIQDMMNYWDYETQKLRRRVSASLPSLIRESPGWRV